MCREHRFIEEDIVERNVRKVGGKRLRSGRAHNFLVLFPVPFPVLIPCFTPEFGGTRPPVFGAIRRPGFGAIRRPGFGGIHAFGVTPVLGQLVFGAILSFFPFPFLRIEAEKFVADCAAFFDSHVRLLDEAFRLQEICRGRNRVFLELSYLMEVLDARSALARFAVVAIRKLYKYLFSAGITYPLRPGPSLCGITHRASPAIMTPFEFRCDAST